MFRTYLLLIAVLLQNIANASYQGAEKIYSDRGSKLSIAKELIRGGYHFTATPIIKEIVFRRLSRGEETATLVENLVYEIGVKQFEALPEKTLLTLNAPSIQFILAKKYFRKKEYKKAIRLLKQIPRSSYIFPIAMFVKGSIHTIEKNLNEALMSYQICISSSKDNLGKSTSKRRKFQLEFNRDNCIVGNARTLYALKKYDEANLGYLDLPKKSYIWPEILFEEAWNAYYRENYNRTLGKLVTYKSPLLDYVYNPEINVLQSLTYYQMCLYEDSKNEIENFYAQYMQPARKVRLVLRKLDNNYRKFFNLALLRTKRSTGYGKLFDKMLRAVTKEPAYRELLAYFNIAMSEYREVKEKGNSSFKRFVISNLAESLKLQRDITGAYVRKRMLAKYTQLFQAFQEMSYIKLEILQKKKFKLYNRKIKGERARGNLKYIKKNDKQYFWDFNHEFWADELGDYVFALKSEC